MHVDIDASIVRQIMDLPLVWCATESCDSCWMSDGKAWEVDGSTQALVGLGLAMPLVLSIIIEFSILGYLSLIYQSKLTSKLYVAKY